MTEARVMIPLGKRRTPAAPELSRVRRVLSLALTVGVIRPIKIGMERSIRRFAPNGARTFFDTASFGWIAELEAGWPDMRRELDQVLRGGALVPEFAELSPQQRALVQGRAWKSFFLYLTRSPLRENCARCPETARLLSAIPGLENAFFSILEPGTQLAPHRGPYAGVLRYHLGLRVPRNAHACGIRVGQEVAHWQEGKSLVFDDSHDHEAWNDTDQPRVVLFLDFARPLPPLLAWANRLVLRLVARASFIEELRHNLRALRS